MQNVFEFARHMYKSGYVVMVELEMFQFKKVLNVFKIPRDQIIHSNDMEPFSDETITQMGA